MSTVKYYNQNTSQWEYVATGGPGPKGETGDKGDTGSIGPQGLTGGPKPDLVSKIIYPMYIAHRNSLKVYPEESMEGQRAVGELGFPIEVDIQSLSDGTLVACHDSTVNRTMDNIGSGAVSSKTPQQWRKARIKPAVPGGTSGSPIFFEQWLDEFGGKFLLVPELKTTASAYAQDVIDAIKDRGLEDSVIVQSFSYTVAKQFAAAGLHALYLFSSSPSASPSQIASDGIEFVCSNSSMTASDVTSYHAAGLKVIMYTMNTIQDAKTAINTKGCDGVFSDDVSFVSENIVTQSTDGFASGYGWPGMKVRRITSGVSYEDGVSMRLAGGSVSLIKPTTNGHAIVYMPHMGKVSVPFKISFTVRLGSTRDDGGSSFGVNLYNNTSDPYAEYEDQAKAGQNGYAIVGRANGQLKVWKYVDGGAPDAIVSTSGQSGADQFADDGKAGQFTVEAEITGFDVRISSPDWGYQATVSDSFAPQDMTVIARAAGGVGGAESQISDIRIEQL